VTVKTQDKPNIQLTTEHLLTLYQEQWVQIRHLDTLDFRTMTILPIVVSVLMVGTGYLENTNKIPDYVPVFAAVLFVGLSLCGCYTTFRNWLCYMRRFSILTAIESRLHMVESRIIIKSIQFTPPQNYLEYNWYLIKSIRFPLVVFYAALGGCGMMIYNTDTLWRFITYPVLVAILIFAYCNVFTWFSLKKEFHMS